MPRVRLVKVPYVEDKTTSGGRNTPSETDVSRMIRATVETWKPPAGPVQIAGPMGLGSGPRLHVGVGPLVDDPRLRPFGEVRGHLGPVPGGGADRGDEGVWLDPIGLGHGGLACRDRDHDVSAADR